MLLFTFGFIGIAACFLFAVCWQIAARIWFIIVPLVVLLLIFGPHPENERVKQLGYDPSKFAASDLQRDVRIQVPAYMEQGATYPVTLINNGTRSYEGEVYVLCTAVETVLDGTTNWVLGIKQYPYVLGRDVNILPKSISTVQFAQMSDDKGDHTNLIKCKLYPDQSVYDAKKSIDEKWIQVTPRGAARAREVGYTWMDIPGGYNAEDYQVNW